MFDRQSNCQLHTCKPNSGRKEGMKDLLRLSCSGVFIAMNPLQDLAGIIHICYMKKLRHKEVH